MHATIALVCAFYYFTLTFAQDGPRATITNDPNPATTPTRSLATVTSATTGSDVAESALASYASRIMTESRFISALQLLATAVPPSVQRSITAAIIKSTATSQANPFTAAWFTALPKDVTSVLGSVWRAEATILASAMGQAVPTEFTTMYPEAGGEKSDGVKQVIFGGAVVGVTSLAGVVLFFVMI